MYSNKYIEMTGETIIKKIKQKCNIKYFRKSSMWCLQSILEMIAYFMIESRIVLKNRVTIQTLSVIQTDLYCQFPSLSHWCFSMVGQCQAVPQLMLFGSCKALAWSRKLFFHQDVYAG